MIINSFFVHFEWFLSHFQISDVKLEFLLVKPKVHKKGIFWAKNPILKKFSKVIFVSPIQVMYVKKLGQNGL